MREQLENYEKELYDCFEHGKKYYQNFYIVVITKKEKLMKNVLRNYFLHRATCPTPQYDEAVYKVDAINEIIDFLWVVPGKQTCFHLRENALTIPEDHKVLLQYVLNFFDGTLLRKAKELNGEVETSIILEKGKHGR
jgi:hypothetical protein